MGFLYLIGKLSPAVMTIVMPVMPVMRPSTNLYDNLGLSLQRRINPRNRK
jgi:hypothetical protein